MRRSTVVAGLLVAGATTAVVAVWLQPPELAPDPVPMCVQLARLQDAVDLTSVGDQAVIRVRAAELAAALAASPSGTPHAAGDAEQEGRLVLASQQIVAVLSNPAATVGDLADAVEPIARRCAQGSARPGG